MRDFIESYLRDAETNHLQTEMSYYAEPLDYFDQGIVDRRFVERDVQKYYDRWPARKYELLTFTAAPSETHPDQITAKFRLRFAVKNKLHSVNGMTDNVFTLNRTARISKSSPCASSACARLNEILFQPWRDSVKRLLHSAPRMKVQTRILLLLAATVVIFVAALTIAKHVEKNDFNRLLAVRANEQIVSFDGFMRHRGAPLEMMAKDFTYWDDLVRSLETHAPRLGRRKSRRHATGDLRRECALDFARRPFAILLAQ